MAGGIDWFRWHHGSVTDPKFALVARRSGSSLPDVLAVWAYLLEHASAADVRGTFEPIDFEAWDCLFGFDDGRCKAIHDALQDRSLVGDGTVTSWDKRQPKREREGDLSTERSRVYRQRQKEEQEARQHHDGACNAMQRQETPREEKRREEEKENPPDLSVGTPPRGRKALVMACPEGVEPQTWTDFLALRKQKKAPVSETALAGIRREAAAARLSLQEALAMCCARGWQGFKAEFLDRSPRSQAGTGETGYQRVMRERMAEVCPGIEAKAPGQRAPPISAHVIDASQLDFRTDLLTR